MIKNYSTQNRDVKPESFITRGKQRLKQHVDTVYLNNGDEFEIELYNPTTNKILAQIEMNGQSIGNGIVLRPGERVFLERYINDPKKFLFETYVVDSEQTTIDAIKNNGDVTVKFYTEYAPTFGTTSTWFNYNFNFTNSGSFIPTSDTFYITSVGNSLSNAGTSNTSFTTSNLVSGKLSETGRIEKGSDSNQSFTYDNSTFNYFPSWTNWWKIKPMSQKVMVKEELVVYCTECGSKRKKDNHKFCPHCGTKY